MIIFHKLTMQNFLSYREKQTVMLANQGIVLLEGVNKDDPRADSNMAGKSSIMEALVWCLFGKLLRGQESADDVVNNRANRNCRVGVSFVLSGRAETFNVVRYRKHRKFQNKLRLFHGAEALSFRHEVDTQRKLEEILDCDFQSFVNSTVFGGFDGSRKQFARLADADQKKVLDSFLRFEKFELALKRTKVLRQKYEITISELQIDIEKQRGEVLASREKLHTLNESHKLIVERDKGEREKIQEELGKIKIPKGADEVVEEAETRIKELQSDVEKGLAAAAGAKEGLRITDETIFKLNTQLRKKDQIGEQCSYCGAVITVKSLSHLLEHIERDHDSKLEKRKKFLALMQKSEKEATYAREDLKRVQDSYTNYVRFLNASKERKRELEERLAIPLAELSTPFSIAIEQASSRYSKSVSAMLSMEQREKKLSSLVKKLTFWETGFGNKGVKTLIVREALPAMNEKLKEYGHEILQPGAEIEFRPSKINKAGEERELFSLHYQSRRNSKNYLGESSGGRRRIDICVLLVFSWLARSCNLLLVDELLDGLDEAGRGTVLEILERQKGTVLVISHERGIKSQIGKVWKVTKEHGVSKIEEAA